MLKVIRQTGHLLRKEIMLAQSIGGGKGATLTIEDMVGMKLAFAFWQETTITAVYVARKLWQCIILSLTVFLWIIMIETCFRYVRNVIQEKTKPLKLTLRSF